MLQRTRWRTVPALLVTAAAMLLSVLLAPPAAAVGAGSLSGTVVDGSGEPVTAVVQFFPDIITDDDPLDSPELEVDVAPDGSWTVAVSGATGHLPPGDYVIRAVPDGAHLPRWYSDPPPAAAMPSGATAVPADTGLDLTDLDIVVPAEPDPTPPPPSEPPSPEPPPATRPGLLSGRVTDERGSPLPGADIALIPADAPDAAPPAASATSGTDGAWQIELDALPAGIYLLRVTGDPAAHLTRWYPDAATRETAQALSLSPGTVITGLDVVLPDAPRLGTLRGRVVANGKKVPGATVAAFGPDGLPRTGQTDEKGRYFLPSLPAGEYRVNASAPQYSLPARWFPSARSQRRTQPVTVAAGARRSGVVVDMSFQPIHPGGPRVKARGPRKPRGLLTAPVDAFTPYQGQRRCIGRPQRGAVALYSLIKRRFGNITIGLNRACLSDQSEHYDGRALDWMVSIRNKRQARKGDAFTQWLTQSRGLQVGANARRLGVMYVIWRDRIWKQYQADKGWQKYYDCGSRKKQSWSYDRPCHRDHVHISLNWPGAKMKTSWWAAAG